MKTYICKVKEREEECVLIGTIEKKSVFMLADEFEEFINGNEETGEVFICADFKEKQAVQELSVEEAVSKLGKDKIQELLGNEYKLK